MADKLTLEDIATISEEHPGGGLAAALLRQIAKGEPGRTVEIGAIQLARLLRWAGQTPNTPEFLARDLLEAEDAARE